MTDRQLHYCSRFWVLPVNLVIWLQVSVRLITDVWVHLADVYVGSVINKQDWNTLDRWQTEWSLLTVTLEWINPGLSKNSCHISALYCKDQELGQEMSKKYEVSVLYVYVKPRVKHSQATKKQMHNKQCTRIAFKCNNIQRSHFFPPASQVLSHHHTTSRERISKSHEMIWSFLSVPARAGQHGLIIIWQYLSYITIHTISPKKRFVNGRTGW